MDKLTMIQELWRRIQSGGGNTPSFFNKLKAYSFYILLAVGAVWALEYLDVLTLPEKVDYVLLAIAGWALGTGGTAATTVKSKEAAGLPEEDEGDAGADGPGPGGEPPKPPTKP